MAFVNPTVQDFKTMFVRDFPFGICPDDDILDSDISTSYVDVNANFNPALWPDQPTYSRAYLLLAAHFLCMNIRASSQGLSGQFNFGQQSKGAGSINEAFAIPQRILDNPEWAMLTKTNYGARYLMMALPQFSGQIYTVMGHTKAQ